MLLCKHLSLILFDSGLRPSFVLFLLRRHTPIPKWLKNAKCEVFTKNTQIFNVFHQDMVPIRSKVSKAPPKAFKSIFLR